MGFCLYSFRTLHDNNSAVVIITVLAENQAKPCKSHMILQSLILSQIHTHTHTYLCKYKYNIYTLIYIHIHINIHLILTTALWIKYHSHIPIHSILTTALWPEDHYCDPCFPTLWVRMGSHEEVTLCTWSSRPVRGRARIATQVEWFLTAPQKSFSDMIHWQLKAPAMNEPRFLRDCPYRHLQEVESSVTWRFDTNGTEVNKITRS